MISMRHPAASRVAGRHTAIDGLSSRVVCLVLFIFGSSLLDAVLTLWHLEQGGSEANPLMALTLAASPTLFLSVKAAASGLGVCFLAAHQQRPLARRGLYGLALVYGGIVSAHVLLVLGLL
jgi:Domain of unknown function (DUF5658)